MDKTVAGVLGVVGALVAGASAQAAPQGVLHASSYADLLRPIPNAAETLRALDAAQLEQVQYYYAPPVPYYYYRHHHHHHHRYYRERYYHHHHHHHHHGYGYYGR